MFAIGDGVVYQLGARPVALHPFWVGMPLTENRPELLFVPGLIGRVGADHGGVPAGAVVVVVGSVGVHRLGRLAVQILERGRRVEFGTVGQVRGFLGHARGLVGLSPRRRGRLLRRGVARMGAGGRLRDLSFQVIQLGVQRTERAQVAPLEIRQLRPQRGQFQFQFTFAKLDFQSRQLRKLLVQLFLLGG